MPTCGKHPLSGELTVQRTNRRRRFRGTQQFLSAFDRRRPRTSHSKRLPRYGWIDPKRVDVEHHPRQITATTTARALDGEFAVALAARRLRGALFDMLPVSRGLCLVARELSCRLPFLATGLHACDRRSSRSAGSQGHPAGEENKDQRANKTRNATSLRSAPPKRRNESSSCCRGRSHGTLGVSRRHWSLATQKQGPGRITQASR